MKRQGDKAFADLLKAAESTKYLTSGLLVVFSTLGVISASHLSPIARAAVEIDPAKGPYSIGNLAEGDEARPDPQRSNTLVIRQESLAENPQSAFARLYRITRTHKSQARLEVSNVKVSGAILPALAVTSEDPHGSLASAENAIQEVVEKYKQTLSSVVKDSPYTFYPSRPGWISYMPSTLEEPPRKERFFSLFMVGVVAASLVIARKASNLSQD